MNDRGNYHLFGFESKIDSNIIISSRKIRIPRTRKESARKRRRIENSIMMHTCSPRGMTCAILRGNKSRNERSRKRIDEGRSHRFDRILNRITSTGEASSSSSCSLSMVVYPSLGFVDFFVSREKRVFFTPLPSTRESTKEGRKERYAEISCATKVGRLQRKHGSYTRYIGRDQSGFLLRPLLDTTTRFILFARIDFDWYSRCLQASTIGD